MGNQNQGAASLPRRFMVPAIGLRSRDSLGWQALVPSSHRQPKRTPASRPGPGDPHLPG